MQRGPVLYDRSEELKEAGNQTKCPRSCVQSQRGSPKRSAGKVESFLQKRNLIARNHDPPAVLNDDTGQVNESDPANRPEQCVDHATRLVSLADKMSEACQR